MITRETSDSLFSEQRRWLRMLTGAVITFSLLFISLDAQAEYNGDFIHFDIHTRAGDTLEAYAYRSSVTYLAEDLNCSYVEYWESYFPMLFMSQFTTDAGAWIYYEHLIDYRTDNELVLHQMIDQRSIDIAEVVSIQVRDIIPQSYDVSIVSTLQLSDTTWLDTPVLRTAWAGDFPCTYEIRVHEMDAALRIALDALETHNKGFVPKDSETYTEHETDYENSAVDAYNERLHELLSALDGRIVIVQMCTC